VMACLSCAKSVQDESKKMNIAVNFFIKQITKKSSEKPFTLVQSAFN
jgi:hypothetical protein